MNNNKFLLILMILVSMTLIPFGDSVGKLMIEQGASPIFVTWSRLVIGAICLLPFSGLKLSELPLFFNWRLILRSLLFVGALTCMLTGIETESLANMFGSFFIGPILSYFLAALILKEKISKSRSFLLLLGFLGALMVIKPGFGMTIGIMYGVLSGCFYGCYLVANRWLAGAFRPRLILITTLIIAALIQTPFAYDSIPDLDKQLVILALLSAISSVIANLMLILVNRHLSASVIAPFVYIQLVAATFFGYVIFNNLPDTLSIIGLSILLVSGFASYFISRKEKA